MTISRKRRSITSCLARASPEIATDSWLATNALCLVCSLYLALCNLWINHQQKVLWNQQQQHATENKTELFESQAVQATVDYLIWSLVTTVFWIVEVALGAAFPSVSEEDFRDDKHRIVDNIPSATLDPSACRIQTDDNKDDEQTEKEIKQQKVQTRVLVAELILALFFLAESIMDCLHWRARVEEDDFVQQEFDIWINIFAYVYMTYETYKTASAKKQWKDSWFCCTSRKGISPLKDNLIKNELDHSEDSSKSNAAGIPEVL
jgi:cation transport ATPase